MDWMSERDRESGRITAFRFMRGGGLSGCLNPCLAIGRSVVWFFCLQTALFGVDLDNDGVDDLYSARYGVAGVDPSTDPDGDGFDIFHESQFETDPLDPADRPTLWLEPGDTANISWYSKRGIAYRPETSVDLVGWLADGALQIGTGSLGRLPADTRGQARYFRLQGFPIDSDGDGLRDVDEERLGTNPADPDTDGDGLGDGFEAGDPALDPLVASDPCTDMNVNGKPDIEDDAASLGGQVVSWVSTGDGAWHDAANWSTGMVPGAEDVVLISPCSPGVRQIQVAADAAARTVVGNASLTVDGAEFLLGQRLMLSSLTLENGANLEPVAEGYARIRITLSGDLAIDASSAIDVSGRGFPGREGPGVAAPNQVAGSGPSGGSHGGRGGRARFDPASGLGATYGSITQPQDMGSGGSLGAGSGGGALRLQIGGVANIDGLIAADGQRQSSSGAGGSIWLNCGTLSGAGIVRANGASASVCGGGGRVAAYFDQSSFTGELQARSGAGSGTAGGAGSVFRKASSSPRGLLVYDNGGETTSTSEQLTPLVPGSLAGVDMDIVIRGGARLSSPAMTRLEIETSGDLTIESGSAIDLAGKGFPAAQGPGAPAPITAAGTGASGGSHGGQGALGRLISDPFARGDSYGSITEPTTFGSGSSRSSGAGGGAALIRVGGALTIGGEITADGESDGGAGAGGSLWIDCESLTGDGAIRANGGDGASGSGGGGRIAIYHNGIAGYTGSVECHGGATSSPGGAGSVFLNPRQSRALLRYDNSGLIGEVTPLVSSSLVLDTDLEISGGARIGNRLGEPLLMDISGDLRIAATGSIDLTGRGHAPYEGPGAPPPLGASEQANGAGHAGLGGAGWRVETPLEATVYGSIHDPSEMGSGASGWGGGALRLTSQALVVDGEILANGQARGAPLSTGSGGSIRIDCQSFSGSGRVAASGGVIGTVTVQLGGAGAGGRIAIFSQISNFAGSLEAVSPSDKAGAAGTIYLSEAGTDSLIIDNGGTPASQPTILPRLIQLGGDFRLRGAAMASRFTSIGDPVIEVAAAGDIEIGGASTLEYSRRALGIQVDLRAESFEDTQISSGFSHGGDGGKGRAPGEANNPGGYAYDSPFNPRMPGSGGSAGGVIILMAGKMLTIDGTVAADAGLVPPSPIFFAPSGGSILLAADTIAGEGTLSAIGGTGNTNDRDLIVSGGGGGRIALYADAVSEHLAIALQGGLGDAVGDPSAAQPGYDGTLMRACFPLNATAGAIAEIAPPSDLRRDQLESATEIFMFPEHLTFDYDDVLGGPDASFDAVDPGTYDDAGDLIAAVVEKQVWTTYLLHADPPDGQAPILTASITFDRNIVGVFASAASIDQSRNWFGSQVPGTGGFFTSSDGIELDAGDTFTISPDRRTLTVTFDTFDGLDQLRVVTLPRQPDQWCP